MSPFCQTMLAPIESMESYLLAEMTKKSTEGHAAAALAYSAAIEHSIPAEFFIYQSVLRQAQHCSKCACELCVWRVGVKRVHILTDLHERCVCALPRVRVHMLACTLVAPR